MSVSLVKRTHTTADALTTGDRIDTMWGTHTVWHVTIDRMVHVTLISEDTGDTMRAVFSASDRVITY